MPATLVVARRWSVRLANEMFTFRERMRTNDPKAILKQLPSIAEFPNAECRNRGLEKVRTATLWYTITFNFMRMLQLGVL